MNPPLQPQMLEADGRRLFSVLHSPEGRPRAGVLMCAPILHEHVRSYRLFALLGDALASHGVAVLRFDYYGTGDSGGSDAEFDLDGAASDAARALEILRGRIGDAPVIVLGIRAGVFPAVRIAAQAQALWLWQPIRDGRAYLAGLRQRDADERRSTRRYALRAEARQIDYPDSLMGFPCSDALLVGLREAPDPLSGAPPVPLAVCDRDAAAAAAPPTVTALELAPALTEWADQLEMYLQPVRPVQEVAGRLAALLDTH
ncbi:serine aminopeptidase domain-containing protein [Dokdonella soli]|uniref:Serine aminopeptidase S33 domain-containing protein n=1 Tax=Dokdonella soli TaxID=529810 RepID=A0ABN1INQ2_9GAMM